MSHGLLSQKEISNNVFEGKISNSILEIPQDIKLEINSNKRLVLKAGSKLYYPNGFEADGKTRKFDTFIAENDVISVLYGAGREAYVVYSFHTNNFEWSVRASFFSGSTQPTADWYVWYDTETNFIRWTDGTSNGTCTFPICILTENPESASGLHDGGLKSIDQTFNGVGFIGSTIYALPGVKGLIADGRNNDGSYKVSHLSIETVKLYNFSTSDTLNVNAWIDSKGNFLSFNQNIIYSEAENKIVYSVDNSQRLYLKIGKIKVNSGVITSFEADYVPTVNTHPKNELSSMGMPSNKFITLTFGTSGSSYVAPATGYFYFLGRFENLSPYIQIRNTSISSLSPRIQTCGASTTGFIGLYMPCRKGDNISIFFNSTPTSVTFAFIYSEGVQ